MLSFAANSYEIVERNVRLGDMVEKYPNNYIVVINGHVENEEIHGDVVAILSKEEYDSLDKPTNLTPKFTIWKGTALRLEEVNNRLGFVV